MAPYRFRFVTACLVLALLLPAIPAAAAGAPERGALACDHPEDARFAVGGLLGKRIDANARSWLLQVPLANPGMLEMFRVRDRTPPPELVPWAGEFVGKYLISAIQALRMSDDKELEDLVARVIRELISTQADDGYLGPFRTEERLLGHWDLWGHYHVMLALLLWHERTEDRTALNACIRAADLICATYLDTPRRVIEAGSPEMNMSVIHVLGRLHRETGDAKYLAMMREIEKDWERAGDYFRTGLRGVEYFKTPRPRWESLHCLQGLVELWRITGDERYRRSFLHHWGSIRRWDLRNTGGFSSGEQATGNPFAPTAIETCCTIAWMALNIDALRLTGDPTAADMLELATYNAVAGAQHPSGRWWTYNTPMDGVRQASAHTIVFQSRAGTPELNCCSVNAPRGLGMLSEWAVMTAPSTVILNHLGSMKARLSLDDGTSVVLETQTRYPLDGDIRIQVRPAKSARFSLQVRIPVWATNPTLRLGAGELPVKAGRYATIDRTWTSGDELHLRMDLPLRAEPGDLEAWGRVSIYRGPLLLAYDQAYNPFDEDDVPVVQPAALSAARVVAAAPSGKSSLLPGPWLTVDLKTGDAGLRLCDFASAGARGTRYRSRLPSAGFPPPRPVAWLPADGARVPSGPMLFEWRKSRSDEDAGVAKCLLISGDREFRDIVVEVKGLHGGRAVLSKEQAGHLEAGREYFWKLVASSKSGLAASLPPHKRFRVDSSLPPLTPEALTEFGQREDGAVAVAPLRGTAEPEYGKLLTSRGLRPAPGPDGKEASAVELDGRKSLATYEIRRFPEDAYSVSVWVRVTRYPEALGQVFSAWCRGMDDPLRVCVSDGKLSARIEAGRFWSTEGVPVKLAQWLHVAAVKNGDRLTLFVGGEAATSVSVPDRVHSNAVDFALGGNPHYEKNESLAARFARFRFYARALSEKEVAEQAK